ncbi:nitroreductase family deazaflavin-dependent oxidoreductase [Isoptericola halotolerans]|uniref:nitroreductase family deazaflavin-dependent oxidoreductase n=1 Tax=Isoptericola halotolerans TaxID=300560 RepID=UPI00388E680F
MTTVTAKRPGRLSRWLQHTANSRTVSKIRARGGSQMGMELLVLHTVGRRSGAARTNPLAYVEDGAGWVVVASGGGQRHPDWFDNLTARPGDAAVEVHGARPVPVEVAVLDGPARQAAWQRLSEAIHSLTKYQARSARTYPVVRLTPR